MKLDKKTVKYIANLARIELSGEEAAYFEPQMQRIIEYVEKINGLNLEGIKPVLSFSPNTNVFRPDQIQRFENTEGLIANFPQKQDRFVKVPKVIE